MLALKTFGAMLLMAAVAASCVGEPWPAFAAMVLFAQCAYYLGRLRERTNPPPTEGEA
jgi:hypothetical protein